MEEINNGNGTSENMEEDRNSGTESITDLQMEEDGNSSIENMEEHGTEDILESQMDDRIAMLNNSFESQTKEYNDTRGKTFDENMEAMETENSTEADICQQEEHETNSSEECDTSTDSSEESDEDWSTDHSTSEFDTATDTETETDHESSDHEDDEVFQVYNTENDFNNYQQSASNSFTTDNEVCAF